MTSVITNQFLAAVLCFMTCVFGSSAAQRPTSADQRPTNWALLLNLLCRGIADSRRVPTSSVFLRGGRIVRTASSPRPRWPRVARTVSSACPTWRGFAETTSSAATEWPPRANSAFPASREDDPNAKPRFPASREDDLSATPSFPASRERRPQRDIFVSDVTGRRPQRGSSLEVRKGLADPSLLRLLFGERSSPSTRPISLKMCRVGALGRDGRDPTLPSLPREVGMVGMIAGHPYHPSFGPLDDLEPKTAPELCPGTHRGVRLAP